MAARIGLVLLLALTATVSLAWSHTKLLDQDEMFVLQTDGVRTLGEVVGIQLHHPISLDPLVYHSLAHGATRVLGVTAFALRLPSLLGYLLMQLCLFAFVRRATMRHGSGAGRAGLLAAALPALTATLFYSAEARPYGLLLGLYALTLLCYQAATRNLDEGSPRTLALVGLCMSIALALNTHYFAVLLLIPVCAAELARMLQRRRIDGPVVSAIVLGMAGIVLSLPFQKAIKAFRLHYYNAGHLSLRAVTQAYRSLLVDYTDTSLSTQHYLAMLFVVVAVIFLAALVLQWHTFHLPAGEAIFLLALGALPLFGFLLARFVTHSYEVRYVIGAMVAIAALLAMLLAPLLARPAAGHALVVAVCILVVLGGVVRVSVESRKAEEVLASLAVPTSVRDALAADPSARLYMQEMGQYEVAQYYEPDPMVRARLTLVYSSPLEIAFDKHDTEALTAEHMQHFTTLSIVPYETLRTSGKPMLFGLYHSGWDFTDEAFAQDHATVQPIAPWFDGELFRVQFP
jgi:hypothetical protein